MHNHDEIGWETPFNLLRRDLAYSPGERIAGVARWLRCAVTTRLTASEFATLAALPYPVGPVLRDLACELGSGHEGTHVAFTVGADNGERWWWLRWAVGSRKVVQIEPCDGRRAVDPRLDDCLLPYRHPGPHSFDIRVAGSARLIAQPASHNGHRGTGP